MPWLALPLRDREAAYLANRNTKGLALSGHKHEYCSARSC